MLAKIVVDTSIIINGEIITQVESGNLKDSEIIIPVAVIDEDERLIGEVPRTELLLGITGKENNNDTKQ